MTEHQHAYHADPGYYAERADGLLASAGDGTPGAVAAFERHAAPQTAAGARAVVAAEHGQDSWAALEAHVAGLQTSGDPFAEAYRAIEARDPDGLARVLDGSPDLVRAQGTNGNDLLGMAGATGSLRAVTLLLDRGADPARGNAHGWTPLHQAAYSNRSALARLLLDRGAPATAEGRGAGGTPLVVALFWGHRQVADVLLGASGRAPANLRVAAGTGDLAAVDALLADPGSAGAARGFYRPHGGFPHWAPSADPQEVVDEALAWAARNDRADALSRLAAGGARLDADVYRGSALAWAAATGCEAATRRLLELGADADARTTFGGPEHGEGVTALHLAAQNGKTAVAEILLAAGADRQAKDALYDGTPADWAGHGGHPGLAERLSG